MVQKAAKRETDSRYVQGSWVPYDQPAGCLALSSVRSINNICEATSGMLCTSNTRFHARNAVLLWQERVCGVSCSGVKDDGKEK